MPFLFFSRFCCCSRCLVFTVSPASPLFCSFFVFLSSALLFSCSLPVFVLKIPILLCGAYTTQFFVPFLFFSRFCCSSLFGFKQFCFSVSPALRLSFFFVVCAPLFLLPSCFCLSFFGSLSFL